MTFVADINIAIPTNGFHSTDSTREGRVLGSLKYEVRNKTRLKNGRAPLEVESIKKIGVEKLKVPISDRCIPTPTFLVTE